MTEFNKTSVVNFLTDRIASYLNMDVSVLAPDADLNDIGLTSINAVMISGEIEDEFQVEIDPAIMFESKTIDEVADKVVLLKNGR